MKFLIWSQKEKAWWKPEALGYTKCKAGAGRFTLAEVQEQNLDGVDGDVPRRADMLVVEGRIGRADAALISAAPDLLAAVKGMLESIYRAHAAGIDTCVGVGNALEAIRRAEGRE